MKVVNWPAGFELVFAVEDRKALVVDLLVGEDNAVVDGMNVLWVVNLVQVHCARAHEEMAVDRLSDLEWKAEEIARLAMR